MSIQDLKLRLFAAFWALKGVNVSYVIYEPFSESAVRVSPLIEKAKPTSKGKKQ